MRSLMSLGQSNGSGKHSTSRSLTRLSRVAASACSALLPTNRTRPGRRSRLRLAYWLVSRGRRLPTYSFSRTATGRQAHSKQGAPRGSTAILREASLRFKEVSMNIHQEADLPQMGKHWINGEWVHSATVVKAVNPSTGEVLGQYSAGGRIEAAAAIS